MKTASSGMLQKGAIWKNKILKVTKQSQGSGDEESFETELRKKFNEGNQIHFLQNVLLISNELYSFHYLKNYMFQM